LRGYAKLLREHLAALLASGERPKDYAAAIEEAARVADQWANGKSCDHHDDNPCCHVRTGAGIAAAIRKLADATGDREPPTCFQKHGERCIYIDAAGVCAECGTRAKPAEGEGGVAHSEYCPTCGENSRCGDEWHGSDRVGPSEVCPNCGCDYRTAKDLRAWKDETVSGPSRVGPAPSGLRAKIEKLPSCWDVTWRCHATDKFVRLSDVLSTLPEEEKA
jgi:hypothetical protein